MHYSCEVLHCNQIHANEYTAKHTIANHTHAQHARYIIFVQCAHCILTLTTSRPSLNAAARCRRRSSTAAFSFVHSYTLFVVMLFCTAVALLCTASSLSPPCDQLGQGPIRGGRMAAAEVRRHPSHACTPLRASSCTAPSPPWLGHGLVPLP